MARNEYRAKGKRPGLVGKKGCRARPEVDYRHVLVTESEVDWLLAVAARNPRKFPSSLANRLNDIKAVFIDELVKVREILARGRANSHYVDEVTAVEGKGLGKDKPFAKQDYVLPPTTKEMKKILQKERANGNGKK